MDEQVKYRYTAMYMIRGFSLPTNEEDKELVIYSKIDLRAILTTEPNPYMVEGDRSLAMAGLLLQAIFRSKPASEEFKHHISNVVEEIQDAREKEFGDGPYLVIIRGGETLNFTPSHLRDAEDFVVSFDGANKGEI